jgi:hypothetical protein
MSRPLPVRCATLLSFLVTVAFASPAQAESPISQPNDYAAITGECMSEHHWDPGAQGDVVATAQMFAAGVCKVAFHADVDDCVRQSSGAEGATEIQRRCSQQVLTGASNLLKWNTVGPKLELEP